MKIKNKSEETSVFVLLCVVCFVLLCVVCFKRQSLQIVFSMVSADYKTSNNLLPPKNLCS